jgi:hypothetical protein
MSTELSMKPWQRRQAMTRTELSRLVRRLYHRRKLSDELPDLEVRLITHLEVNSISKITVAGYRVERTETELVIAPVPRINESQLSLIPEYYCLEYERTKT